MRAGEVTGSAHECVVIQNVEDAGYRLDDVVFAQFGVTAAAAVARPFTATPAFPESAPSATAAPVTVVAKLGLV